MDICSKFYPFYWLHNSVPLLRIQISLVSSDVLIYSSFSVSLRGTMGPLLRTFSFLKQTFKAVNTPIKTAYIPKISVQFSSVQSLSHVRLFVTPWTAAHQAFLSITNSRGLLKLMSVESVMPSNHLILCRPLLFLPSIFPSIWVFSNESTLHIRWPKYQSFTFSISPSNEYSGLISFRMDWLDLLSVQGILKSLLQCHSSKASILWSSAFFIFHSYIHTWLLKKP